MLFSMSSNLKKPKICIQQALEKKSDDIDVRTDLGITFVERKNPDFDRAIKEFQASLSNKSETRTDDL